ncbi:thermonuclease family protein [Halobacillus naozhouensis]|uniref:Thermonuclease family protein n=1 Tax=Halobacillus naozhouensis TaxID=554880 RepID=A0ABY8IZ56_9BACI|nr:thermonuclease family protein [Halobacillus naozhouensis]WFT75527.1 thermonuclease family protein [Halobacillus naozhouensis]
MSLIAIIWPLLLITGISAVLAAQFKPVVMIAILSVTLIGCTTTSEEPANTAEHTYQNNDEDPNHKDKQNPKPNESSNDMSTQSNATVTRVVDGDTLEVTMNGKTEDVRLLLIDTPETVHPSKPVQPFGPEASQFVKEKLTGEKVRIEVGKEERDHYGRLLAYVYFNGETIQEKLLQKGLARTAYLYNDLTMLDEFHEAQKPARTAKIGVWSIPGYAHVDHNHGYHYQEASSEKEKAEPNSDLNYDPDGPDRDCGDFTTQQQAQNFFEAAGGPSSDPHRLDGEGDGLVCEGL